MKNYLINWKLKSPLETDLESDTIFGHICWSVRYIYGEDILEEFISELKEKPLLVLSSGFPKGYLPFPANYKLSREQEEKIQSILFSDLSRSESYKRFLQVKKKIKEASFIKRDYWAENKSKFSYPNLILDIWEKIKIMEEPIKEFYNTQNQDILLNGIKDKVTQSVTHNTIDRKIGSTTKNGANLYDEVTTFYKENTQFHSYLTTDYFTETELRNIFEFIEIGGYGKNKSTGKGVFDITISEKEVKTLEKANAWLILSNFIPDAQDSKNIAYTPKIKYGKLGGGWAGTESPFKFPLLMFTPGSVTLSETKPLGKLMQNIHPYREEIVQNLYAYSIPFRIVGGSND